MIDVAVTDGSDLVALVYGGAGGRGGDPGGDDGERGSPGQVHTGDYASNPTAVPELVNMDSWTIMLYSAADDATSVKGMLRRKSIEDGLEQELDGMELIRLSDTPVNMLVLMDRHPDKPLPEIRWPIWQSRYDYNLPGSVNWAQWHNTRWGWVSYDDSLSIEEEPEGRFSSVLVRPDPGAECELNTGNPRTLSDFVNWATTAAQAEHRMLVVGSHGSGRRGMAHDDTDKDRLFLPELAEALDDMTSPIDILVIEACICSTVEVLAELAHGPEPNTPRVGYVVAAQSTTNGYGRSSVFLEADGFEIKGTRTWLEDLASGVDLAPKALATRIGNEWTMVREVHAAFDLSMYFDCEKAIREFVDAVLDPNVSTEDIRQLGKIRDFHSFSYSHRDLFMFMLKLDNALSNQPQAIKIMDAAKEVRSAFVPMRMAYTSGMGDPPNAGLSVWFPSWAGEDMSEYQHLEFAKATRWHLFLRKIGDTFLGVYDQFNPYFFPDDIPDSEADAQPLDTLGGTSSSVQTVQAAGVAAPRGTRALVESYLHSSSDLDWYRFQADAGQLLHMDIVGLSGGLLSEGMATVFSPQGGALTTVEADHDGGIANAIVRLPASGTYYIQVASSIMSIPGQPLVGQGLYSLNLCLYDPDAYEPNLVVDASELDFSAVEGGETQVGTITLTNLGGASIEIAGIGLEEESSPFLAPYSPLATPFALGPGEAIEIDVGMQSYQGGVAEDTLVVVPTDANYAVVEIPLRVSSYDPNDLFVVGGGVYTDLTDPPTSGLAGVWMTLDGGIVPYTTQTGSGAGLWQIEGVPTGAYTLTPSRPGYTFEHVSGGIPDGQASITVEVNEANEPVNRDVQFLAHSRPGQLHDWNGDGIVSIVGDVPLFVNCVYFQDCPDGVDNIAIGDCNGDGILSIVGDVPCFVECVYFGNCSE
ncbi:MAG: hypothetical protein JW955_11680 [Sedimentisphaerales bacterium]|nr:hypothetical protein [Sedimentisphaerales bacterium]